jgi:microcystin-dependent protein
VTYSDLFDRIGIIYGAGDLSTTFNLPDCKGRAFVAIDPGDIQFNDLGEKQGSKTHTLTSGEMPQHRHTVDPPGTNSGTASANHSHGIPGHDFTTNYSDNNNIVSGGRDSNNILPYTQAEGWNHYHHTNISSFYSGYTGSTQAHNNIQPSIAFYPLIKY